MSKIIGTDVIVEHQPGAGGLLATNTTWAAPADGLRMTLINASAVLGAELAGADGVLYQSAEFGWVGRVSSEPNLVVSAASNPRLGSLNDLINASVPVRFAATGAGSVEYIDPVFLREVFSLSIDLIAGFGGGPEAFQSVLAGDTDAQVRTYGSQRGPVLSGDAVPILIIGNTVPDEIAGTPTIFDIATGDQIGIAQRHADLVEMGRGLIAPPGMDPAVLQLLRDAYAEIGTNQALLQAAETDGRPISFMSGEEQYEVVLSILNSPASYVDVLREAFISAR
jgi:tripartite-type tricarboxylate transporter receptor subunit TctC